MQSKKFQFSILIGALVIMGLTLLFQNQRKHSVSESELKPSQLNFVESNQPQALNAEPNVPVQANTEIVELPRPEKLNPEEQQKWTAFKEILETKNDNDPRTDQLLKHLSPKLHATLISTYQKLPVENRNGRGLVAFLISRDLQTVQDAEFLKEIYQEQPCMSFEDCSKTSVSDPHLDGINQTSLNYPQLAGLYQIEQRLASNPDLLSNPDMRSKIANVLREARQFPVPPVQKRAEEIQTKYGL